MTMKKETSSEFYPVHMVYIVFAATGSAALWMWTEECNDFEMFWVFFSIPLQMRRPVAHQDQKDVSCVQTARHSEKPRALWLRIRTGEWTAWWWGGGRGRRTVWAHTPPPALQSWFPIRDSGGLFIHHHYYCPVSGLPSTLRLTRPRLRRLRRLPLPTGGHRLRERWPRRRQAPLWWRHCTAYSSEIWRLWKHHLVSPVSRHIAITLYF